MLAVGLLLSPAAAWATPPSITSLQPTGGGVTVTWTLAQDEDSDYVEIASLPATDSDGFFDQAVVWSWPDLADTTWTSPELAPGTYYVHVRGRDAESNPEWSSVRTFSIGSSTQPGSAPTTPAPGSPSLPDPSQPAPTSDTSSWSWLLSAEGASWSLGLFSAPAVPTLQSLADSLGQPDRCSAANLLATWDVIGMTALLQAPGAAARTDDCAILSAFPVRRIALTEQQWVTVEGLHVGDPVSLVRFFYPAARLHRSGPLAGYWLAPAPHGKPGRMVARIESGYVSAFVLLADGKS